MPPVYSVIVSAALLMSRTEG